MLCSLLCTIYLPNPPLCCFGLLVFAFFVAWVNYAVRKLHQILMVSFPCWVQALVFINSYIVIVVWILLQVSVAVLLVLLNLKLMHTITFFPISFKAIKRGLKPFIRIWLETCLLSATGQLCGLHNAGWGAGKPGPHHRDEKQIRGDLTIQSRTWRPATHTSMYVCMPTWCASCCQNVLRKGGLH